MTTFTHRTKQRSILILKGFCMGAADVVPGVSGGTVALILGIYPRWLLALRSFDALWLKALLTLDFKTTLQRPHFGLLIPLFLGLLLALFFFTRVIPIPQLLHSHPEPVYGLFFGLILGSILTLIYDTGKFDLQSLLFLSLGTIASVYVVNLVPFDTPHSSWFIFVSGFISISAMLLPGLSGSFILLILRQYDTIFGAIGRLDFSIILPFVFGIGAGFVVFSRVLTWLLGHYYRQALLSIIGILIGSLSVIWPFQQREYSEIAGKQKLINSHLAWPSAWDNDVILGFSLMLVGFGLILGLKWMAREK